MAERELTVTDAKRRILDVAARLFREQGYASVSLRAIARDADMKAGSIYYHFASKEDLVVEILDQGIRSVHEEVEREVYALQSNDCPDDHYAILCTAIRAHLRSLLRQSDYTSANVRIFGQVPKAVRERSMATRLAYETFWDKMLAKMHSGNSEKPKMAQVRFARLMILGSLNASLEWFNPRRGSIETLAKQYADLIWNGLPATLKLSRN